MKDRTRQGYPGAQAPEKGRAIPPRSEETGLPSPFTVKPCMSIVMNGNIFTSAPVLPQVAVA